MEFLGHISIHSLHNMQFKSSIYLHFIIWLTFIPIGHVMSHNLQSEHLCSSNFICREGILIFLPILAPIFRRTPCGHRYLQYALLPKILDKAPIANMEMVIAVITYMFNVNNSIVI